MSRNFFVPLSMRSIKPIVSNIVDSHLVGLIGVINFACPNPGILCFCNEGPLVTNFGQGMPA